MTCYAVFRRKPHGDIEAAPLVGNTPKQIRLELSMAFRGISVYGVNAVNSDDAINAALQREREEAARNRVLFKKLAPAPR